MHVTSLLAVSSVNEIALAAAEAAVSPAAEPLKMVAALSWAAPPPTERAATWAELREKAKAGGSAEKAEAAVEDDDAVEADAAAATTAPREVRLVERRGRRDGAVADERAAPKLKPPPLLPELPLAAL